MKRKSTLVLPHALAERLRSHLFPGDGLESAALLFCTVVQGRRTKWLARDALLVPHQLCSRSPNAITWPGEYVEMAIDQAEHRGDSIIAIHSHPGGLFEFSPIDDDSDSGLMPALWHGSNRSCGSAIMMPDGAVRARFFEAGKSASPFDLVAITGHDIQLCWNDETLRGNTGAPPMAFTSAMTKWLSNLSVCVVGVSGTGSIVAEQLARLGVGEIILIDFDTIEERNLNRILNSTRAEIGTLKVDTFAKAIRAHHRNCRIVTVPKELGTREAILAAAEADIVFSCVDTGEGRHVADRLGATMCIPIFDVGVTIPTAIGPDGMRRIAEICGRIDYVFPSGTSLMDRGVYDAALLEAEYLARTSPDTYARRVKDGYIRGVAEEAPSVISVNMRAASACVTEAIARLFPFREKSNSEYARTVFMLAEGEEETYAESSFTHRSRFSTAVGLAEPLLGLPSLALNRSPA